MSDGRTAELKALGRYNIERTLGKGAMGVVYEGLDPKLNRRVAIKTILKSHLDPDTAKDYSMRFSREAQAVARLNHPHIVQVYDFAEEGDIAYLVMEFIRGKELKNFFDAAERFDISEAVRIMGELLDALEFAHNAGIIHRDIKPANVMLDAQARTKLTDFGVARVQDVDRTHAERTQAGTMVGTPAYMSPEQITGGNVDKRTDVFSAGIILYQFLTGEKPFTGGGAWTIAKKIIQEDPPLPSSLNNAVTPFFDAVVNKALSKNPETRYQSAKDFGVALKRALEGRGEEEDADQTVVGEMSVAAAMRTAPQPRPAAAVGGSGTQTSTQASNQEVELEFWRAIKDGNDPDDFELYVQQFPTGIYAALAKRKIAKLRGAAARGNQRRGQPSRRRRRPRRPRARKPRRARSSPRKRRSSSSSWRRRRKNSSSARRNARPRPRRAPRRPRRRSRKPPPSANASGRSRERQGTARRRRRSRKPRPSSRSAKPNTRSARRRPRPSARPKSRPARKPTPGRRPKRRRRQSRSSPPSASARRRPSGRPKKAKKESEALAKKQAEERAKREAEFKKREAQLKAKPPPAGRNFAGAADRDTGRGHRACRRRLVLLRAGRRRRRPEIAAMQKQLEDAKQQAAERRRRRRRAMKKRRVRARAGASQAEEPKRSKSGRSRPRKKARRRARARGGPSEENAPMPPPRQREAEARKTGRRSESSSRKRLRPRKRASRRQARAGARLRTKPQAAQACRRTRPRPKKPSLDAQRPRPRKPRKSGSRRPRRQIGRCGECAPPAGESRRREGHQARGRRTRGRRRALLAQASALEQQGKGNDAVKLYVRAARSGNGKAAKRLGDIYDKGLAGVSRDYAESLKWYNAARVLGEEVPLQKSR